MKQDDDLGHWSILTAENEEGILIIRLRTEKPHIPSIEEYETSIILKWEYVPDSAAGMPGETTKSEMDSFERQIDELTAENGNSYLMAVATGIGLREWHFYAKDYSVFSKRFNSLLRGTSKLPIDIEYYHDPEWRNWRDLADLAEHNAQHG